MDRGGIRRLVAAVRRAAASDVGVLLAIALIAAAGIAGLFVTSGDELVLRGGAGHHAPAGIAPRRRRGRG